MTPEQIKLAIQATIGASLLAMGFALGWGINGWRLEASVADLKAAYSDANTQRTQAIEALQIKTRQAEIDLTNFNIQKEQEKQNAIADINARHATELDGLRKRPDRPASTGSAPGAGAVTPACQAATGAELSRSDAGFLSGEAARANVLREALGACYDVYDEAAAKLATFRMGRH